MKRLLLIFVFLFAAAAPAMDSQLPNPDAGMGTRSAPVHRPWRSAMRMRVAWLMTQYNRAIVWYFLVANSSYMLILIFGFLNARRRYVERHANIPEKLSAVKALAPISILVPCYNEEKTVVDAVRANLRLNYPEFEIVVCNDGSRDKTLELLKEQFHLIPSRARPAQVLPTEPIREVYISPDHPNLIVIDKENGGKADALNAAINQSNYPLVCCVDADSIVDYEGLLRLALPFFEDPERTVVTGGSVFALNTYSDQATDDMQNIDNSIAWTWMDIIQRVEYLRAFMVGRMGWDWLNCHPVISGAFGLFKKSEVIRVGGYLRHTIGEDMELMVRLNAYLLEHKKQFRMHYLPDPVCWTQAPTDLVTLGAQRSRWQQGLAESLWKNRYILFRSWSGRMGWFALPYMLLFELLSAPLEIIGYLFVSVGLYFGVASFDGASLFFAVTIIFGCLLNLGAVCVDQLTFNKYKRVDDIVKLLMGSILEHFGFRQIHLYWRLRGIYRWLRGKHLWGQMRRRSFLQKQPPNPPSSSSSVETGIAA